MKLKLLAASVTALLSACGGGSEGTDTSQPAATTPTTTFYTASASAGVGGRLSPASLSIESGKQGTFSVSADSGYVLDSISGCGGDLNGNSYTTAAMGADCSVSAGFITNAENAIRHQDHSLASDAELIDFARDQISDAETKRLALVDQMFQGISSINWHPSHDSITFSSYLPGTTFTLLPLNVDGSGNPATGGLVMVSDMEPQRMAAMAANMFSVDTSTGTDLLLKQLIHWLTRGQDQQDGLSVVTAQVPSKADSWYFPHNEAIRSWLASNYPDSHSINEANVCDYQALGRCIDERKPDLILLSDIDRESLGHAGLAAALEKAKAAGIPLLLANYEREESAMLAPLYRQMGLATRGNYWGNRHAANLSVDAIKAADPDLIAVDTLLGNLRSGHFDTALLSDCGGNFLYCDSADFAAAFKTGADWLRGAAKTLDHSDANPFDNVKLQLLQANLLLADKYRAAIDYPIAWEEHQAWQQAMFADWLVSYARPNNPAQPDLGEFVTDRSNLAKGSNAGYALPVTETERRQIAVPYAGQWTTTGWYALPGQRITLTRHDNHDVSAEIKLNYHRSNTNRAFQQHVYRGPLELATQRLVLAPGQSLSFSSPYGGPIYLYLAGNAAEVSVDVTAEGIAHHPSILDFSSQAQIDKFNQQIQTTELPHVDLRTDGAEQHLRRDRFLGAIGGNIPDVTALLRSIVDDHINSVYTLAGLKIQGKTLAESLPADVRSACSNLLGANCLDAGLNTRKIIQHANYDQNAHCGGGCSGNPWDASWEISPTGWGDNHELGHNLQTNRLNVQYAAAADTDNWPGYGSRAGENSNNIFPYFVKWKSHYVRDGSSDPITDGHMNHKDLFYAFMSDAAKLTDGSGNRVVLAPNCQAMDSGADRYEAPWKSNAYAVHNGYRMAFYVQMVLRAHRMTLADGTVLENGFNLVTLLYQHSRIFGKYANQTDWDAHKDSLGFGLFPYSGHAVYGGRTVAGIPGNDFMLVSLSKLTGIDWRSHFDLLGLRYSSLAAAQVAANAGKGALPMGMYVLETNLPPANMSSGLSFLPLSVSDGSTLWQDGSSPVSCPKP
ncbi:ImpA family metalloprotease [Shewanella sedimentimangrovi]|uniref:ImpA family metalloprotease n=1 Tax=Shewanella sedimentimangrovi TaxID=2814293 RepID=A0ABX7R362_9GAMM|nr:ImpA family metalloprotease [Shewanella sedimentimangrovi]QSX37630.1 ImpA family metalloprotease [Shewanella sedimentimangrovi]